MVASLNERKFNGALIYFYKVGCIDVTCHLIWSRNEREDENDLIWVVVGYRIEFDDQIQMKIWISKKMTFGLNIPYIPTFCTLDRTNNRSMDVMLVCNITISEVGISGPNRTLLASVCFSLGQPSTVWALAHFFFSLLISFLTN